MPRAHFKTKKVLVKTTGKSYKKKKKERQEQAQISQVLEGKLRSWLNDYGHAEDRHAGLTGDALEQRNIPLATTFETNNDLFNATKELIVVNERKLNDWFNHDETERIVLWCYMPDGCTVKGKRKLKRPDWHYYMTPMPAHPGFEDVEPDNLEYVIGVFDRDYWTRNPLGLMTCFPAATHP